MYFRPLPLALLLASAIPIIAQSSELPIGMMDEQAKVNNVTGSLKGQVEFIQNSTSLPFGNENIPYQKLVSERESLFLFTPETATDAPLFLTLSLDGKKKKIKLSRPEDLPKSDQPVDDSRARLEYSTQAWSTTIGWEWMQPGLSVTISNESGEQSQVEASIFEWGAPSKLVFNMMRIGMLGKVREINGLEKEPLRLGQDYFDVMPISELVISNYLPVELDTVVMPNGDVYTDASPDLGTWHAGDMRSDIAKGLFSVGLNNASFGIASSYGDSASQPEYYNNRMVHQAAGVYRNGYIIHGGSGGNGMLTMDNLTSGNELTHEAGHSYGQSHFLRSGKYASHNLFSGWTYDTAHRQLRANIDWKAKCETPESCINKFSQYNLPNDPNYQTEPFKDIYRFGTDAQAGGHQSSSIASYTNHTAYSNRSIQQYLNSRANLDENSSSGYVIWDDEKQAMVPLDDDVRQKPLSIGVPVTSLVGFYDPSGKLNGYAYQPLVSNYGTTFEYPSAQNIQDCTATVSTKSSESISFGVRGDQSNSGVMNRYHVNLPLDTAPTHVRVECPVFIEFEDTYQNWLSEYFETDSIKTWNNDEQKGHIGDIYHANYSSGEYYYRLLNENYWNFPPPKESNRDWEYVTSKEALYPQFEATVEPDSIITVLDSALEVPTERPPEPVFLGKGQGIRDLPIATTLEVGTLSENYTTYTPTGNDKVYFTVPAQGGVVTPVTLESSDATVEGPESFTPVDVRLVNESGVTQVVTLRARKKVWGQWKPILDKTGPGEGEILLNVDISDNPNLDFSQHWTGSMVIYVHSASNADFLRPINVNIDINELADEQTLGDLIDRDFSDDTDGKQFFFIPPQEGVSAPESIDGSDDGVVPSGGLGGYDMVAIDMLDAQGQPHKVNLRVSRTMYQSRSHITDARDKNNVHLQIEYSQEDNLPQTQGLLLTGQLLVIQQGYDDVTFQTPHLISLNIDTSNLGLDEWSRDFSADTPSGNSSVYFYTPVGQSSVIESGSDAKEDARWGAEGDYTRIVSQLKSIDGQTKNVVLRGYKNIGSSPLNEGMQRGYGKAVLRYVSEDNPTLVTDDYLFGDIQVVGQGWHDNGFHSLSKVKAQISTIADIQAFDSSKGSYYSPVYLQEDGALYYFVVPEQGSGVKGPKSSTVNASEGGRNEVTLWLEDENTGYEYPVSLSVQKQGCYLTKMNDTSTCEDNTSARLKVRFLPEKNEHLPEGEYSGKVVINRLDANDTGFIKPILLNVDIVVRKGLDGLNVTDFDGDGIDDVDDQFPSDISESVDSDMDGVGDNSDAFPHDDSESLDTDGDGVGDNSDAFPRDESETTDSDGDGVGDNSDDFPNDPTKSDIAEIQMVLNSYQLMQTDFSTFSESSGERMFFYIPNTPDVIVPSNIDNLSDGFIETTHTPDTFSKIQVNMRGSDGGQYAITLRVSRSAFGSSSVITDARDSGDVTLFVEYHHEDNPTIPDLVLTGKIQVELQGYDNTSFIKQLTIELSIDSQVHHLGEWSRNYSEDTESGDSSVYFYIPKQPSAVYSDSDEPEDRRWGEERSYTSIVAHLMNERGELQDVTLRGYKNSYGNKAMNEGMQKGHGQFKLSFFSEDNPNIAPNTYLTGKIKVLGQGWHEPDFMVTSWVDVTIDTAEEVRINETNTVVFSTESSNVESSLFFLQAKNQVSGNGPQVGIWSGEEKSSFVTFDVTEQHEQRAYPLTLRMGKRGCYLFEMNNGVYCSVSDLESLKVEYVQSDNEHLPSGHYVGSYYIQERNWFDSSDSRAIKVSVDVLVENKMIDSDGDGVVDSEDIFPNDPSESKDADDDGVGDNSDVFPHNALESMDSDGDGVGDNYDQFPLDSSESLDSDNDGIGDNQDEFSNVAGSYTYYTFGNAPSSFNHVQFSTEVMEAPGAAGKVFWSNQFRVEGSDQGGYTGLQSTGSLDRKIFLFSLWNTSEFRNSEDGGVCKAFDHEGSGTSCSIAHDWTEGTQYLFDVTFDSGWLNVSVTNAETKESFDIGSIKTDASGVSSAGMVSWTEFWGGGNCYDQPKVTAKFDVPKVDDDQTTATVSSVSPSSYCSDMTSIELLGDASIQRNYINSSGIGYVQHQSGMLKAESLTNDAMVSVVPRSMTLPMTAIKVNNPVTNKEFCLDARNGSTEDGTIAQVYSCNGTAAQKWGFDEETQLLINKKANKCLTSTDSGILAIYDCNLSDNQKWTYTENRLIHTGTELCLSVEPEISLGAATSLQSCYSQEESQLWKMNRYPIEEATWVYGADKALHIGKNQCLEADSLSGSVTINACNGSSIQSWLYDEGRLFHSSSNKCLEYKNESSVLTIGECNDQDSQIWALP